MYGSLTLLSDGEVAGVTACLAPVWDGGNVYKAGDTVAVFLGLDGNSQPIYDYYQCLTTHTSGPSFRCHRAADIGDLSFDGSLRRLLPELRR